MRERVMHNIYYEHFETFRYAIIGFLNTISHVDSESVFGKEFASRIRDKFRPIGAPI